MKHITLQIDAQELMLECDLCDWEFPLGQGITMSQMIAISTQHRSSHSEAPLIER